MTATTSPSKPQFLLLIRQPPGPPPSSEFLDPVMKRFGEWMQGLYARGAVIGTNGLGHTGRVLRGSHGATLTDGPFAEGKEVVGGYVLVAADDIDQATDFARGCPGLDCGLAVEVRPIVAPPQPEPRA